MRGLPQGYQEGLRRQAEIPGRLTTQRECRACHTDHKGRKENIAPINESTFDHSRTNFSLTGAHADPRKADCKACHKPKIKYRDTPSDCYRCHQKDDRHKTNFGEKCAPCHTENKWGEIIFDHDRDTKYRLSGKHRTAKCESCHAGHVYKDPLKTDCVSCHKKDDRHKGVFGPQCRTCHDEHNWKTSPFNHDKDTTYPLLGKHKTAKCESCHMAPVLKERTPTACYACHKKDDKHQGQQGTQCDTCHRETSWKEVSFNHDMSRFPLRGRHNLIECATCHKTLRFKDAPSDCNGCHEKDDIHKQRFSSQCETCHTARAWKVWDFDHNRRTSFPLDGAHQKLDCYECHSAPMPKKVVAPKTCIGCHRKDDRHEGGFGPRCEHCHSATLWKAVKPGAFIRKK